MCAILGILLAGTVPLYRGSFQGASLRRAAGDLAGTFRHARSCAVAEERAYQVGFDKTDGTYRSVSYSTPKEMADAAGSADTDATVYKRPLPKDVIISAATYSTNDQFTVTFYPDGTADEGSIQLALAGSEQSATAPPTAATASAPATTAGVGDSEQGTGTATVRVRGNDGGVSVEGAR